MKRHIEPIVIPTKDNGAMIELRIIDYVIGSSSASIEWNIYSHKQEAVLNGMILIEGQDFLDWGSDDEYIINFATDKLNLKLI